MTRPKTSTKQVVVYRFREKGFNVVFSSTKPLLMVLVVQSQIVILVGADLNSLLILNSNHRLGAFSRATHVASESGWGRTQWGVPMLLGVGCFGQVHI